MVVHTITSLRKSSLSLPKNNCKMKSINCSIALENKISLVFNIHIDDNINYPSIALRLTAAPSLGFLLESGTQGCTFGFTVLKGK